MNPRLMSWGVDFFRRVEGDEAPKAARLQRSKCCGRAQVEDKSLDMLRDACSAILSQICESKEDLIVSLYNIYRKSA